MDEHELIDKELSGMVVEALQAFRDALKKDSDIKVRLSAGAAVLRHFNFDARKLKVSSYKNTPKGIQARSILDIVDELRLGTKELQDETHDLD